MIHARTLKDYTSEFLTLSGKINLEICGVKCSDTRYNIKMFQIYLCLYKSVYINLICSVRYLYAKIEESYMLLCWVDHKNYGITVY